MIDELVRSLGDAETATATWEQFTRRIRRFGTEADILVLAVVLIATSLVETGFGSPAHPLRSLLKRAETVLVVRMASHTEADAVFEVAQVLRGDPKLQKLSLSRTRAGLDLPENTGGLLLFSQGDSYRGKPKDSFQVGQPIKGQRIYRGWILTDGPGQSKEELDRLTELVKKNPFTQSRPERRKAKTAKEAEATPGTTEPARHAAVDDAGRRLSDKTMEAVKQLKTSRGSESFDICLNYFGPERGEAVHSLLLQREDQIACPPLPTLIAIGIPKERAGQIIVHLAELGFFDRAKDVDPQRTPRRTGILKGPTYVLTVESLQDKKGYNYYLDLGWNWQMLQFLDGFRKGLVGEEAKGMDKVLAQLEPERKAWDPAARAPLTIEMGLRQPADAPVILKARLTNTSDEDIQDDFEQATLFRALLMGPKGSSRWVQVTNGARTEGSFGVLPKLSPGESVATPLRLTNAYQGQGPREYLPSEHVYLPPGEYYLRLDRLFPGPNPTGIMARAELKFAVVRDADLTKARFRELRDPPEGDERFAEHVLKTTLTPEIRQQWYEDIKDPDPGKAVWKVYTLSIIANHPPDVTAAILEALKIHVKNKETDSLNLHNLLNAAVLMVHNYHPPGAGPPLLELATGTFHPSDRKLALEVLWRYYRDDMADKLVPLLEDEDKWIPLYSARLLAWAGDDRGADVLIVAAQRKNTIAAAALAYLPQHPVAAEAHRQALMSDDQEFVRSLKVAMARQPRPRNVPPPDAGSDARGKPAQRYLVNGIAAEDPPNEVLETDGQQAGARQSNGIETCVRPNKQRYRVGESVYIAVDLFNNTDKRTYVGVHEEPEAGIQVTDIEGRPVTKLYKQTTAGLLHRTLQAHQRTTSTEYDLALQYDLSRPGRYRVRYAGPERSLGWVTVLPSSNAVEFEVVADGVDTQQGVALPAPSGKTTNAVKRLKANMSVYDFRLSLRYWPGPRERVPSRGEGISSVYITTATEDIDPCAGTAYLFISKLRAKRIIDHLAKLGFFDRAKEVDPQETLPVAGIPKGPTYVLKVPFYKNNKGYCYYLDLGWNLQMLRFLDGFRKGLVGEEAKAMDKVLAQLEPERRRWQATKEPEAHPADPPESADQLAATGKRSLDEQLANAKGRLAAILPDTMTISRAEVMQTRAGPGLLLHASPADTSKAHPSFALLLWPRLNNGVRPIQGAGAHTWVRIGQSEQFVVFYSSPTGVRKAEVRRAFCEEDPPATQPSAAHDEAAESS